MQMNGYDVLTLLALMRGRGTDDMGAFWRFAYETDSLGRIETLGRDCPDHFVTGPWFVMLTEDVDCDGTFRYAHGVRADNLADALAQTCDVDGCVDVLTLSEARLRGVDVDEMFSSPLYVDPDTNEPVYYARAGASLNPWVYDDTLGTVLDHSHDDALTF